MSNTTTRNATLEDLAALLTDQQTRKLDVVAPATAIRSKNGVLVLENTEVEITEDGVTQTAGRYVPTAVCDEGIADKLGIPVGYLRRLRTERPDLYDFNVNAWLHGRTVHRNGEAEVLHPADDRSFLMRLFRGDNGEGVARAMLSQNYRAIDNLDVLTAALSGIRDSGAEVEITRCDLTERRMYVDVHAPQISALAPVLLKGYRNPFDNPEIDAQRRHGGTAPLDFGYGTVDEPIVFAGFRISNSEVGGGAFTITPKLMVKVCMNGMVVTADALRAVHLGGKLDDGIIQWSEDTQRKQLELITAKARDAVTTFLDTDYVLRTVGRIEAQAGKPIDDPAKNVEAITKQLGFTKAETAGVLDHFIRGGQMTAGGVVNAITSYSQTVSDADRADNLDAQALRALQLA